MNTKICCIFNYAPHYRLPIYKEMDQQLSCDFYFGDRVEGNIKKLDYSQLSGFKAEVKNVDLSFKYFKWQKGVIFFPFKKKYKHFILTGDASILSNLIIIILCLFLRKKTYLWMHGLYKIPNFKAKMVLYPFYKLASHLLLYGHYAKYIFVSQGFKENKISVIYNSLDYNIQKDIRQSLVPTKIYQHYFTNAYPVLIYIGRIQAVKKVDHIIKALAVLKEKNIFYNLIILGDNDPQFKLEKLVFSLKLEEQVHFFGPSYDEKINGELIFNADLCVSPGNIGLTAIHAMSYGTPCITHNDFTQQMPEFEIIEENKTGLFFQKDSVIDLAEKITEWSRLNLNRDEIRLNCYHKIDQYYNPFFQVDLLKKILR